MKNEYEPFIKNNGTAAELLFYVAKVNGIYGPK